MTLTNTLIYPRAFFLMCLAYIICAFHDIKQIPASSRDIHITALVASVLFTPSKGLPTARSLAKMPPKIAVSKPRARASASTPNPTPTGGGAIHRNEHDETYNSLFDESQPPISPSNSGSVRNGDDVGAGGHVGGKRLPNYDDGNGDGDQQGGDGVGQAGAAQVEQTSADGDNGDADQQDDPGHGQNNASGGSGGANPVEGGLRRSTRNKKATQSGVVPENVDEGPSKKGGRKKETGKGRAKSKKATGTTKQKNAKAPAAVESDDDGDEEDGGLADDVGVLLDDTITWLSDAARIGTRLGDSRDALVNVLKRRGAGGGGPGRKRSKK
ncbi:hypothetical protein P171DRAFT_432203 [Karstenula rhodostoma CBS 690.94]|uniref:Uncharacterized protein n=1 Tax=Karstenula rhodostoma CBS 690.94 TaxID=1392251 RepID=A0A9P4U4N4_9PLEO|nr:hypothetical protein P171DRAFT_437938 [Karstenula rhodostoma CBS 690.94]KAF2444126.1 hypothetical protein P171DRAFT_432203 [Karstenula rhodostoma CBS 690.94]